MRLLTAAFLSLALSGVARADDVTTIWTKQCKSCHGMDGKADTETGRKNKTPDITTEKWQTNPKHTDAWIRAVIANGIPKTKMKGYSEKLSAEQIDALVAHVRTLKAS